MQDLVLTQEFIVEFRARTQRASRLPRAGALVTGLRFDSEVRRVTPSSHPRFSFGTDPTHLRTRDGVALRCYAPGVQDTSPQAQARYFELLGRQTSAQRFASTRRLTAMVRQLALAGLREARPSATDGELRIELARRLYGNGVAERLRLRLTDG